MKGYQSLIFIFLFANQLFAGIDSDRKLSLGAERKLADHLYNSASYYTSYDYYKDITRRSGMDRRAIFGAAMSLMMGRDYENSALWFKKMIDLKAPTDAGKLKKWNLENETVYHQVEYNYAMMLKMNGRYEEAKEWFEKVKSHYTHSDKASIIKRCDIELAGIAMALGKPNSIKYKLKKINEPINKGYSELAPIAVNDSLMLFSTIRKDKTVYYDNSNKDDLPVFQIFRSVYEGGEWTALRPFVDEVNDKNMHTVNGAFSEDGNRFYFTKCKDELNNSSVKCHLYMAERKVNVWKEAVILNEQINHPHSTSTHPTVRTGNNGRDIIYYATDRPGGKGGMDIWSFVRTKDGNFRAPQPVKAINTEYDEVTPFYSNEDSTLVFSSNGYPSYGGFDLFKSIESETTDWSPVENLGLPFNSCADDQYYNKTPHVDNGFITSNRVGSTPLQSKTCCDDIYRWSIFNLYFEGAIFQKEKGDARPLEGAIKKAYRIGANGSKVLVAIDSTPTPTFNFKFPAGFDYEVVAEREGYEPVRETVSAKEMTDDDSTYREFGVGKSGISTRGIVYDEAKGDKTLPVHQVNVTLFEQNPKNGNEKVVAKKTTTAEDYQLEFPIEKTKKYRVVFKKPDYFTKSIFIEPNPNKTSEDITTGIMAMEIGKAYSLNNIYYEYKKADLTYSSMGTLDTLILLLNDNPSIVIELGAHTDSIGNDQYNLKLSQQRAESCVKYMVVKGGIKPERVKPVGYGELKPIAPNSLPNHQDNPEGRQKNRRTEFKIIGKIGGTVKIKYGDKRVNDGDVLETEKSEE